MLTTLTEGLGSQTLNLTREQFADNPSRNSFADGTCLEICFPGEEEWSDLQRKFTRQDTAVMEESGKKAWGFRGTLALGKSCSSMRTSHGGRHGHRPRSLWSQTSLSVRERMSQAGASQSSEHATRFYCTYSLSLSLYRHWGPGYVRPLPPHAYSLSLSLSLSINK